MTATLSTHVLDNYHGRPAANIPWSLARREGPENWVQLSSGRTNTDGRTDGPILGGEELTTARYRITFEIQDYYAAAGVPLSDPPFLDSVPIEVNLISGRSYHVPLLMTPWSYSTYRGS